jgi:hypothetical protein
MKTEAGRDFRLALQMWRQSGFFPGKFADPFIHTFDLFLELFFIFCKHFLDFQLGEKASLM